MFILVLLGLTGVGVAWALLALFVGAKLATMIVGIPLALVMVYDFFQKHHSLGRIAPGLWRGRLGAEQLRPEFYQYFIESPTGGRPIPRIIRDWLYRVAKKVATDISFGTEKDYNQPGQIHIRHASYPIPTHVKIKRKVLVVGPNRKYPMFLHGRFGIGDVSFGAWNERAKQAVATGASRTKASCVVSSGEGGLTPYDFLGVYKQRGYLDVARWLVTRYLLGWARKSWREEEKPVSGYMGGGQKMLEVGTAKFGVRHQDGSFDWDRYAAFMRDPSVVASKIKKQQGAKPNGGGHLPGKKVTKLISLVRGIPQGKDCISPNTFDEFANIEDEMAFIKRMQEVSQKPVGIKIAVGRNDYVEDLARWMSEHPGEGPDFVHIDGGEGGSGSAPPFLADYVAMSIIHAIPLVDNIFRKHGVRDRIIIMSSGKAFNPAQMFIQLCLGSDFIFGVRGVMVAGLGCIQAKRCGNGDCPSGQATQHWWYKRALVPEAKFPRVTNYGDGMEEALTELLRVVGKHDTYELNRSDIMKVTDSGEVPMDVLVPYPEGCDQPRTAPIAETYGLTAPAAPPKPTLMSDEIRSLFGQFFDADGKLIFGGESRFDVKAKPGDQLIQIGLPKSND